MDKQFEELRRTWDHLGDIDPLWAILTDPQKRGNRWDLQTFLATGRDEIDQVVRLVSERFPDVPRSCALDFGCGVGRLSRALAAHFQRVIGIDVAASMIRQAREVNSDIQNCEFVLNERPDLSIVPSGSVDLVYSNIVLAHIEPRLAEGYIREFVRVLSPKGLAVFQAVYPHSASLAGVLTRLIPNLLAEPWRRIRYGRERIKIHTIPIPRVHTIVREAGGSVVGEEDWGAVSHRWKGNLYFVRRLEGGERDSPLATGRPASA